MLLGLHLLSLMKKDGFYLFTVDQGLVLSDNVPTLKLDQTNYVIVLYVTEGKETRNSHSCFDFMFSSVFPHLSQ